MANFNKVLLMGRLTRDPELSYTPSNTAVVDFGLAVNRKWKSKDGVEKDETCFVDCVAFAHTANAVNKYCHKGDLVFVEGRLALDSWTAQDGSKRSKHKVVIQSVQFIGGKPGDTQQRSEAVQHEQQGLGNTDDIPF